MRVLMGVWKHPNGAFYARKKVPERLVKAAGKSWLKKSLDTRDAKRANILAKPVLIEFDNILARAEASLKAKPLRDALSKKDIDRIAAYHHASMLAEDDTALRMAPAEEALLRENAAHLKAHGVAFTMPLPLDDKAPAFGRSARQGATHATNLIDSHINASNALATGNIGHVSDTLDDLLDVFEVNLDRKCDAYYQLGLKVPRAHVAALEAVMERRCGAVIATPQVVEPATTADASSGDTLRTAFEGWKLAKTRTLSTLGEFEYALRLFEERNPVKR